MEHIHGIDVSWMTHGSSKEKPVKQRQRSQTLPARPRGDSPTVSPLGSPIPGSPTTDGQSTNGSPPTSPRAIPSGSPSVTRINSADRLSSSLGTSPSRRASWFSNISSRFSSSTQSPSPQGGNSSPKPAELSVPKANPAKNAVLQHAAKNEGEGPYTPAPPRTTPSSLLHVFRRLSSSNGTLGPGVKGQHGLVERMVLNVDHHRERCQLSDLDLSKLRRVAFCVDVEIAPMPKYAEADTAAAKSAGDKAQKKKLSEKSEGEALKNPKAVEEQKEKEGVIKATGEQVPKEPAKEGTQTKCEETPKGACSFIHSAADKNGDANKKKEKKKKSEEERKARKEKKRKLAEANGQIPMEIYVDSDSSCEAPTDPAPRTQYVPTTNPVRIYRRCCQLRETPILKKITEQLANSKNLLKDSGMVDKLDLTGYWLQLPDLITLGDYLAVVPIREVILENCGLTDEGLRVILAGLLATKKPGRRHRKPVTDPSGLAQQGGVVERLVLKNNKIGPEGWRHICLFLYMCRTIKYLDLSSLHFPHASTAASGHHILHLHEASKPLSLCELLSRSLGERLAGNTLELINIGDTGIGAEELGTFIDGAIQCGIQRLSLAHNDLDEKGVEHVLRYIASGKCEGLDLGGNAMQDHIDILASSLNENTHTPLRAISLADCNLTPTSLGKLLPVLIKLKNLMFIDLSHNHELFQTQPSAVPLLRRYLPKLQFLKRIHLTDTAMNASQAIALAEILPEIRELAHISLAKNPELTKLADARTEDEQEEACALFASLLAATRVSQTIVAVDIDVPTDQSSEIVRAMAKQVVAYCLRNMERLPITNAMTMVGDDVINLPSPNAAHPDVVQHLVSHDSHMIDDEDGDEAAPDDDYVIGGTGVVKALACCLDNRGDESRRPSGEFTREPGSGTSTPRTHLGPSKAKDMSKHLLGSARRIRQRLQPALARAKAAFGEDTNTYHRLQFLDQTLEGMIKRFEEEFPETREPAASAETASLPDSRGEQKAPSVGSAEIEAAAVGSDNEDETEIKPGMSRSNSVISLSSKGLTNEEGRILRAGHRFRAGWFGEEHINILSGIEDVGDDPKHVRILHELLDDVDNDELKELVAKEGPVKVLKEHRQLMLDSLKAQDPEHWDRFIESQLMARANVKVPSEAAGTGSSSTQAADKDGKADSTARAAAAEVAVSD